MCRNDACIRTHLRPIARLGTCYGGAILNHNACDALGYGYRAVIKNQTPIGQVLITTRARLGLALVSSSLCVALCSCSDSGTVTTQLNLRKAPASRSEVVATIPKGSVVTVRGCTNGWCRTSWNGNDGYILTKYVRIGDSAADVNRQDSDDEDSVTPPDGSSETGPSD